MHYVNGRECPNAYSTNIGNHHHGNRHCFLIIEKLGKHAHIQLGAGQRKLAGTVKSLKDTLLPKGHLACWYSEIPKGHLEIYQLTDLITKEMIF